VNVDLDPSKLLIIRRKQRVTAVRMSCCDPNAKVVQTKVPNNAAAEKAGSAENRDNTIARGCHGSSVPILALGFSQLTHASNKAERFLKIAEAEGPFDAVAIVARIPIRSLRSKTLRFLVSKPRDAAAARGAFLLGESLAHVLALG
jgi:hypothetical protein